MEPVTDNEFLGPVRGDREQCQVPDDQEKGTANYLFVGSETVRASLTDRHLSEWISARHPPSTLARVKQE